MIDRLRTWARNGHVPKAMADDMRDAADEAGDWVRLHDLAEMLEQCRILS